MIIGPKISTSRFHYNGTDHVFSEEISTLSEGGRSYPWGQLFDDACDEGFVLVSQNTGKELPFYLSSTDECEGEILGWWFKPVNAKLNMRVLIIND